MGKRKAEHAAMPAEIDQMACSTSGTGPFAVYFPSGFNPNGNTAQCTWSTYEHAKGRNHYTLVARTDRNVDFIGSTVSAEYTSEPSCSYALGVYDKRTGQLEVMPVEGGRILRMEPRVHGQRYSPKEGPSAYDIEKRREHNKRLVEEFGSQRRKRQLAQAEAGVIKAEQVSAAGAILDMVAAAGEGAANKEEVVAAALAQRNIPPHNPFAHTAEEAYRTDDLVPVVLADALEIRKLFPAADPAKTEYRDKLKSTGQFGSGYVLSRLELLDQTDDDLREKKARMLVMLGHLLKLYLRFGTLRGRGLEEMSKKSQTTEGVLEQLLEMFYSREDSHDETERYVLSKEKKALMLAWILALAVRVEAQAVLEPHNFTALADELKMRGNDLVGRFRELGCKDISVNTLNSEGVKVRGYKIMLLPPSAEEKTLGDCFPGLKLGGKKPAGR